MLQLLAFMVTSLVFSDVADAQCFHGWVQHGGSCYGFGEDYVSWAGASSLCNIFDGTLAEIESVEENEFLKAHARSKSYGGWWIGGIDVFSEGYWIWSGSKQPISEMTDWGIGEPNHYGGSSNEDCMQLYAPKNYTWNDQDCGGKYPFVCEVKMEGGETIVR